VTSWPHDGIAELRCRRSPAGPARLRPARSWSASRRSRQPHTPISTTIYTYDHAVEPRGFLTSMTDSVAGTLTARWGPDGQLATQTLPGGVRQDFVYDTAREPLARVYTDTRGTAGTDDDVVLVEDRVVENSKGQWVAHATETAGGTLGQFTYAYDQLGRLTDVTDLNPAGNTCTWRRYEFSGALGSRVAMRTTVDDQEVGCTRRPTAAAADTHTVYVNDTADRLVSTTTAPADQWVYDLLGRTTVFPAAGGPVTNTFYVNDLIAQQNQGDKQIVWDLDPAQRRAKATHTTAGTTTATTSHYGDDTDNPIWITEGDGNRTRYLPGANGELALSVNTTGDRTVMLTNLHGDITATLTVPAGASTPDHRTLRYASTDEFGNPRTTVPTTPEAELTTTGTSTDRYGWLGAHRRSTETLGGLTLMGVRLYHPTLGRFLTIDPIPGGNTTAYVYPQDPINKVDLDGRSWRDRARKVWNNPWFQVGLTVASLAVPGAGAAMMAYRAYKLARGGVYVYKAINGQKYVGQSGNVGRRLSEHVKAGNCTVWRCLTARVHRIDGNKTRREVAEQRLINRHGGIGNLRNQRNPIGARRAHLLHSTPKNWRGL
jgi:RHS repeat-associated protein